MVTHDEVHMEAADRAAFTQGPPRAAEGRDHAELVYATLLEHKRLTIDGIVTTTSWQLNRKEIMDAVARLRSAGLATKMSGDEYEASLPHGVPDHARAGSRPVPPQKHIANNVIVAGLVQGMGFGEETVRLLCDYSGTYDLPQCTFRPDAWLADQLIPHLVHALGVPYEHGSKLIEVYEGMGDGGNTLYLVLEITPAAHDYEQRVLSPGAFFDSDDLEEMYREGKLAPLAQRVLVDQEVLRDQPALRRLTNP